MNSRFAGYYVTETRGQSREQKIPLRLGLLSVLMAVFSICLSVCLLAAESGERTSDVNDKHIPVVHNDKIFLTLEEHQWLSRHDGQIRIGITVIPPQILNIEGEYKGLCNDYIQLIEDKLGCRFKLVPYATWNEVIQAAKMRQIDMIFAAQMTPERLTYLLFTDPYIELPNMILVRKERQGKYTLQDMKGWNIATSEGSAVHEYLKSEFGNLKLKPVPDELAGLMKLSMGEVDAMVVEISRASYYIEQKGILNLRVAGDAGLLYQLRFAVRSDWPILCDILDKGLSAVSEQEKHEINRRWIIVESKSIFKNKKFLIPFAVVTGIIILGIATVIAWNYNLRRIVRQRTCQLQKELAEREKAGRELRASEKKYKSLIEKVQTAIVVHDGRGYILDSNPMAHYLLGLSEDQLLGKALIDPEWHFLREDESVMPVEEYPASLVLTKREPLRNYITGVRRPDRQEVTWALVNAEPDIDDTGEITQVIVSFVDITERKQAQQNLSLMNFALNQVCEAAFLIDENARFHFVNEESCRILGYAREELLALGVSDIEPDFPMERWPGIWNDLKSRQSLTFESHHRTKDNRIFPVEINANYLIYGGKTYILALVRNITERKRAEEALRESEKQVRHKLDAILSPDIDISNLELPDVIDAEKLQSLMDEFYRLTDIGIGIIDLKGKVLVGTGWQDICTKFHRVNPESCRLCIESDLELSRNVQPGTFKMYRCKLNMWDIATPIMLGDKHVGNIFLGQFLFDDEVPDYEVFRQQARRYGFDEQEYIAALDRVPRWSHKTVDAAMSFYSAFSKMIGDTSYNNIKLANALENRKWIEEQLRESRTILKKSEDLLNASQHLAKVGGWEYDVKSGKSTWSEELYRIHEIPNDPTIDHIKESMNCYRPDDQWIISEAFNNACERGDSYDLEFQFTTYKGNHLWIRTAAQPVYEDGKVVRLIGNMMDVTDRKQNEAVNAMRLHLIQFSLTHSLNELLEETLNGAEELTGSLIGFYHFVEGDQKTLSLQEWSTRTKAQFCKVEGRGLHYSIEQAGIWVDCIYQRKPVIHNDYASLPHRKGMPEGHASVTRELVVPVSRGEKIMAILGIGNKPTDYTEKDVEIVSLIADLAWEIAERKRSEEALREREEFLFSIVENIPDMIFIKDAKNLKFVRLNRAGEELLGFSRDELIGKTDFEFFPMEQAQLFSEDDKMVLRNGKLFDIPEELIMTKHGERFLHTKKIPILDDNGEPAYLLGISEDITERKQMYEAMRSSEERLLMAVEASEMGLWDWNIITGDVIWSDQCKAHYGFSPETSMNYELFLQALHPDDRDTVEAALNHAVEEGAIYDETKRTIWPDGSLHWTNSRGRVYYDSEGKPIRMVGVTFDITERKLAEAKLLESEERFRSLVTQAADAFYLLDSKGRILDVNQTACNSLGYNREELLSLNIADVDTEVENSRHKEQFWDKLLPGSPVTFEGVHRRKDGSMFPVEVRLGILEFGNDRYMLGLARDITDRKQSEEALHRLNRELIAISECNQALLRAEDEQMLLNDVCRIVCDKASYKVAWVGFAEHDADKTIRPVAWAGEGSEYIIDTRLSWSESSEYGQGLAGKTIRSGQTIHVQDFLTDPSMLSWRESAIKHGYRSGVAMPLKDEKNEVFGIFMIYSSRPDVFIPEEINLLQELANDLAFGVSTLRIRQERNQAVTELKKSEVKYIDLYENAPDMYVSVDAQTGLITQCNSTLANTLGYSKEKIIGQPVFMIYHPDSLNEAKETFKSFIKTGRICDKELQLQKRDGSKIDISLNVSSVCDEEGTLLYSRSTLRDITRRKQAEKEKFRADQRLRLHHEFSPLGFLEWDEQFRAIEWNAACERIFGYTREEAIGHHAKDLILPAEVHELVDSIFHSMMNQTGGQHSINENITKDGRIITCEWYNTTLVNKDGKTIGVASVCQDITDRKQVEEMRQSNLHFFESMDKINRAIQGANDLDTMMSDVLDVVLSIFDCDRAFLMYPCDPDAETWYVPIERTKPEYPGVFNIGQEIPMDADVAQTLRLLLESEGPVVFGPETSHSLPEEVSKQFGFKCFMSMAIYPKEVMPWQFGIHQCSYARIWTKEEELLLQEIGRRLADALSSLLTYRNLQESQCKLSEAQRIAHIGNWELNLITNVLTWSDETYRIFEINPEKFGVSYEAFLDVIHPEDREVVNLAYARSLETRIPYSIDHRLRMTDGRIKYVHEQCETFYDANGKPLRSVGIIQDITMRKRAEEEIRTLNQELEERIARRTAQLEAANKELEAFAYSVSHDLRAPLRGIDGFSQILLEDYFDKMDRQGGDYLRRVRAATQQMGHLIEDMLTLSRISRSDMIIEQVDLSAIARKIAEDLLQAQPERQVEFVIRDRIRVRGDSRLLRIVLDNLLQNAWKFTSKHPVARIEFGRKEQNQTQVYFVCDDGAGFDMNFAEKLFGAFQRLHTVSEFPGTGIGLATVQRIIHRHGGKVWAEGYVEKGATIYFSLP